MPVIHHHTPPAVIAPLGSSSVTDCGPSHGCLPLPNLITPSCAVVYADGSCAVPHDTIQMRPDSICDNCVTILPQTDATSSPLIHPGRIILPFPPCGTKEAETTAACWQWTVKPDATWARW